MRTFIGGLACALGLSALGCGNDASKTIAALLPAGVDIHDESSEDFEVSGRDVTFTHVEYGALNDCPSGCFSSHVCAIEEDEEVLLYYAFWTQESEAPTGITTICPGTTSDTRSCETPGKKHPLASSAELKDFLAAQREEGGPFRWCLE